MVILYALLSALGFGTGDFLGGYASRKNSPLTVIFFSQGMGFLTALVAAPLLGASRVLPGDILWGMTAGICGAAGA